jgi:hypothetical protein
MASGPRTLAYAQVLPYSFDQDFGSSFVPLLCGRMVLTSEKTYVVRSDSWSVVPSACVLRS